MADSLPDSQAEQPGAPHKRRRRNIPHPYHLQERDVDILTSLEVGRCLTPQAVEWLHFPDWRERYAAYLKRRETDATAVIHPAPRVYQRLIAMREADPPLIYQLGRQAEQMHRVAKRLSAVYVLARAGADVLARERGLPRRQLRHEELRERAVKNLGHATQIGTCYAALRAALEFSGRTLDDWLDDHRLSTRDPERGQVRHDRIAVPGLAGDQAVIPDATFTLAGQRLFVEVDTGTRALSTWQEKARVYEAYRRSRRLRERYAVDDFTLLVVAPDTQRQGRIAEEIIKVVREAPTAYLFTTADQLHPTTVRARWSVVSGFTWQPQQIVGRRVEVPAQVQFSRRELWARS